MEQNIVTNKFNKKQYLLNTIETDKFFQKQDIANYTIKRKATLQDIINNIIAFIIVGIGSVGLLMLGAILDRL